MRLRAIALERGETVQGLIGDVLDRFLIEADRKPPVLTDVIGQLRAHSDIARKRGVTGLWVFGSVARGEAQLDSDIDLLADFDPDVDWSILDVSALRVELSDLLGREADLMERGLLRPSIRQVAEQEAVRVF